ncbi:hypothetical protein NQZ68_034881 [Dissostichus eleginoides]|nr:hypothetical protein NQZ68_034881 [Dissostichus eleginoides]
MGTTRETLTSHTRVTAATEVFDIPPALPPVAALAKAAESLSDAKVPGACRSMHGLEYSLLQTLRDHHLPSLLPLVASAGGKRAAGESVCVCVTHPSPVLHPEVESLELF